ncbi:MAG TPA: DUF542 domain-containing protein [Gemmatimonadaceae bacterium]|nr:DUF542 domain-containing protein [Gemmatimonadaceae bacterium]
MARSALPLAPITAESRVDEALFALAAAPAVMARYGLDTCCGGARTLRAAAEHAGVPLEQLLRELGIAP